jgi:5-methylcytosine-specific restriction endonuclease McrA
MGKVLVLNASYEPLNITNWKRAVVLLIKDKAEQVEQNGKMIYANFPLPSVIRLRQYIRVPYTEIPLTRRHVLQRDDHSCQYCGYKGDDLTLDHVIPRSKGGPDSWENIVTACISCNVKKGNRTPKQAQLLLQTTPRRPYSSLYFELSKHLRSGKHQEWKKYTIGIQDN